MAEVALAWVCAKEAICCPLVGAGSVSQLENNVKALDFKLTQDEIETLDQLYRPRDVINDQVSERMPRHLGGVLTVPT
jgi:aryl-alcohol dehydrogenase-like predicted oxidoreductase